MFKNHIVCQDDSKVCNNYVHVAGFPGTTSSDILAKINDILSSFMHKELSNTVILSIGVNDTQIFNGEFKNDMKDYISNIKKIARIVINNGCNLILLDLTRIESNESFLWKPNKYYDNTIISEYDNNLKLILDFDVELKELCKNHKITYLPMKDILEKIDFIDGLHPNHNGHKKIFEYLSKSIVDNIS